MKAFLPLSAMLVLAAAMYQEDQEDQEDQNQTSERERIEIGATIPDESIQAEMGGMIKGVCRNEDNDDERPYGFCHVNSMLPDAAGTMKGGKLIPCSPQNPCPDDGWVHPCLWHMGYAICDFSDKYNFATKQWEPDLTENGIVARTKQMNAQHAQDRRARAGDVQAAYNEVQAAYDDYVASGGPAKLKGHRSPSPGGSGGPGANARRRR
ncbi:hypothetical protein AAL_06529 [Moelleriella libera RCEF 2490]|uniref:Uncharacterized protein n=1 Tax=Moelleriella libera RCEF 2490 TaxID=1081109 RepID=A0A167YUH9_9HYPO|nr:hypothetical protein AAL_06529 [Moelleriella libera RCEF 2490]